MFVIVVLCLIGQFGPSAGEHVNNNINNICILLHLLIQYLLTLILINVMYFIIKMLQYISVHCAAMNSPMLKDLQKKECQLEDLIDVIPHFMADWQLIGLKLDMKTSVNNLRNNGKDNRNNCTQLFEETLEQTSLTWGRLFKILNDLGKITIIQQIERELVEKRHRSLTQSSAQTFGNGDPQQDRSTSAAARAEIEELPFDRRNTKAPSLVNEFEVASHTNGKSDASGKDGDAESDCDGDSVGSDAPLLLTSN